MRYWFLCKEFNSSSMASCHLGHFMATWISIGKKAEDISVAWLDCILALLVPAFPQVIMGWTLMDEWGTCEDTSCLTTSEEE